MAEATHPLFTHADGTQCVWIAVPDDARGGYYFQPYDAGGEGEECEKEHPRDDWIAPIRPSEFHSMMVVLPIAEVTLLYSPNGMRTHTLTADLADVEVALGRIETQVLIARLEGTAAELRHYALQRELGATPAARSDHH